MATHLTRYPLDATAASGYSNKWTWSGWVKRAKLGADQGIIGNKRNDNNTNSRFRLFFKSNDKLAWECKDSGGSDDNSFETNMLFRDTNAWYHIVFIYDSDNSTETDRMKCYVNGKDVRTELGGFSSVNEVGSGFGTLWSSAVANYLGTSGNNSGIAMQFEGCMSHCHLTYGYRYEASTFGSFDSTTGEWKINTSPSVTYGSQGYFLLKDNASVTDQSGEGNNYTATGTLTKTEDCPSNVFATINPLDNFYNGLTITNGNTSWVSGSNYSVTRSTLGASSGKYYFEMKVVNEGNTDYEFGIVGKAGTSVSSWMGSSGSYGYSYESNAKLRANGTTVDSWGSTYDDGDILGCAFDLDNNKIYFSKNGSWQESGDPSSGSNGYTIVAAADTPAGAYFVGAGDFSGSAGQSGQFNFGNGYFGTTAVATNSGNGYQDADGNGIMNYSVPTNYRCLCTIGLNQ